MSVLVLLDIYFLRSLNLSSDPKKKNLTEDDGWIIVTTKNHSSWASIVYVFKGEQGVLDVFTSTMIVFCACMVIVYLHRCHDSLYIVS